MTVIFGIFLERLKKMKFKKVQFNIELYLLSKIHYLRIFFCLFRFKSKHNYGLIINNILYHEILYMKI